MSTQLNGMGAVVVNTTPLPATNLSLDPGVNVNRFRHDDREFASIGAVTGAAPVLSFQTPLKNALDVIGLRVLKVTALDAYLAKYTDSVHDATSDKYSLAVTPNAVGYAIITGFNVTQGGIALANVSIAGLSADGSVNPFVKSTGAIPAITEPLLHTLGPSLLNNVSTNGLQGASASLNQRWAPLFADGDLYPQVGTYDGGDPIISLNHNDPVAIFGTDYEGAAITATTSLTFLAMDPVTQVPTVTGQIVLTIADGRIVPRPLGAAVGSIAAIDVDIIGLSDSAHVHPWAIS